VREGDRFRASVGFLKGAGGEVEFVIEGFGGTISGTRRVFTVRDNGNDGILRTIDEDLGVLSGAAGMRLVVNAGATSSQDWAVWINPRIERKGT
jgi:hypothetical protein